MLMKRVSFMNDSSRLWSWQFAKLLYLTEHQLDPACIVCKEHSIQFACDFFWGSVCILQLCLWLSKRRYTQRSRYISSDTHWAWQQEVSLFVVLTIQLLPTRKKFQGQQIEPKLLGQLHGFFSSDQEFKFLLLHIMLDQMQTCIKSPSDYIPAACPS